MEAAEHRQKPEVVSALSIRYGKAVALFPGVLASVTIAVAATFLSEHYGGPVMLYALLLGMAFYFLSQEGQCVAGIGFSAKSILRFGVALLGMRITVNQILQLGIAPLLIVFAAVVLTIGSGLVLSRVMKLRKDFGLLTGGAVAICGASAALAISAVLPKHEHHERDAIFAVIGVTTLSTVAMIIYPMIVTLFGLDSAQAGVVLGGTIHDVAQVVGAGYSISTEAGDNATFVKLLRVAMLLPSVFVISLMFRGATSDAGKAPPPLPAFLVAFAVLVMINSTGLVPAVVGDGLNALSRWCLVTAIAALGMKTSIKAMLQLGWAPVMLIVGETLFLLALVLGVVLAMGAAQ
ncbi:MAG TPA: putative sulfate exporter family transporter [Azospirillum sp.]|nr:putative sulfate exporter family transporter [Azospirillum sp.]